MGENFRSAAFWAWKALCRWDMRRACCNRFVIFCYPGTSQEPTFIIQLAVIWRVFGWARSIWLDILWYVAFPDWSDSWHVLRDSFARYLNRSVMMWCFQPFNQRYYALYACFHLIYDYRNRYTCQIVFCAHIYIYICIYIYIYIYVCFLHWACGCKSYVWNVEP